MAAILFGSISTLADTSELQREAFNGAFAAHGLDWRWEREEYLTLLQGSGGEQRIRDRAVTTGETVDAAAVHRTKSGLFQRALASAGVTPRPGVIEVVRAATAAGTRLALVSTTSSENVSALLDALAPDLSRADFDLVVDRAQVSRPKPDPEAYRHTLQILGVAAEDCVAIEDNIDGVRAAVAAGVTCIAFPNANTAGHDFAGATVVVDHLEVETVDRVRNG